jgi:hypothetical protein
MSKFDIKDIIRFVDGEMEGEERSSFEQELLLDTDLKKDFDLYMDVHSSLKIKFSTNQNDGAFKANLKQLNNQYFQKAKTPSKIISLKKYWYAAAIVIIGLFLWAPWNQDVYQKYGETNMVSVAERGENDQQLLQEATEAFNKKDFKQAKEKLEVLVAENIEDDMLKFYYGVSLLETNESTLGRKNLEDVFAGESLFKDDAAFYIALSYLKEKDKEQAKEWLLKIDKDADVYEKTIVLLKQL